MIGTAITKISTWAIGGQDELQATLILEFQT